MRKNTTPGFLITFCGLDGCGKTTMIKRLIADLEKEHEIFVTKQPTNAVRNSEIFRTYMDSPELLKEDLNYQYIKVQQRNYKN